MAALTGYAEPELAALDPEELAASSDAHRQQDQVEQQALRQSARYHGERQRRRRDGSLIWVQVAQRLPPLASLLEAVLFTASSCSSVWLSAVTKSSVGTDAHLS